MRKQHTLLSKSGKLLLALGMMFSLVAPYSVHANEPVTPSDGEVTPSNGEVTPSDGEQKDTAAKTENGEYDVMPMAYDTDAPVIDKVELSCNGQKVKPGEEIKILVTAYDDTAIKKIRVGLTYENSKNQSYSDYNEKFTATSNENEYEVKFTVQDGFEEAYINFLRVTDQTDQNFTDAVTNDGDKKLYSFTIENTMIRSYVAKSITFDQNNKTLARNDKLRLTVVLEDGYPETVRYINTWFYDKNYNSVFVYLTQVEGKSNTFVGETTISQTTPSGEYKLSQIRAEEQGENGTSYPSYDVAAENLGSYKFTLTGEDDLERPVITSIEMTNQGKMVKPGDSVQIKIQAEDNISIDTTYAYVHFNSTMDVENGSEYVDLTYDEVQQAFIGTFEITDSIYPCEWYIDSILIKDTFGNQVQISDFVPNYYSNNPYYFYVNNDGTFVNKSYNVKINFQGYDEKGYYTNLGEFKKDKVLRRTTFKEMGLTFPKNAYEYDGLEFLGWFDSNGVEYNLESIVMDNAEYLTLYAKYNKTVAKASLTYPSTDGTIKHADEIFLLENGSTYRDLLNKANSYQPKDLNKGAEFKEWGLNRYDNLKDFLDQEISMSSSISLRAEYKDKIVLSTNASYYDKKGLWTSANNIMFVNSDTSYDNLSNELNKLPAPESYEGLRFSRWEMYSNSGTVSNYDNIYMNASYENHIVVFAISDEYRQYDRTRGAGGAGYWIVEDADIYPVLAETGETIKVPEIAEYKNIKWLDPKPEGENLVIEWNTTFVGYGDKVDGSNKPDETPNEKPDEKPNVTPDEKPDSNQGSDNTTDNETVVNKHLPNEKIMGVINEVLNTEEGATIEVDMEGATFVPVQLLQVIKGKDINIKLDMGGYNWTINGKDILTSNLQDIDLEVTLNSNAIPNGIVSELAGDNPVQQLSLTHNGDFGFKASLGFNIGSEHSGKFGNLFYYDSEGKMKFMNAGKIEEDGNVSLDFTHASEYAVVINDKIMSPEKNTVLKGAIKDTSANPADTFNMLWVMSLTGLGMYYYFKKKETEEQA